MNWTNLAWLLAIIIGALVVLSFGLYVGVIQGYKKSLNHSTYRNAILVHLFLLSSQEDTLQRIRETLGSGDENQDTFQMFLSYDVASLIEQGLVARFYKLADKNVSWLRLSPQGSNLAKALSENAFLAPKTSTL